MFSFGLSCYDDENCVYVADSAGFNTQVRRTTDGGITWETIFYDYLIIPTKLYKYHPRGIVYTDRNSCFILFSDSNVVMRTLDGGGTWDTVRFKRPGLLSTMVMRNTTSGYAAGAPRWLLRTGDAWRTWDTLALPDTLPQLFLWSIAVPDDTTIIILMGRQNENAVFRSTDAGATWRAVRGLSHVKRIAFANSLRGCAIGEEGKGIGMLVKDVIYRTEDGGITWELVTHQDTALSFGLLDVAFADPENAIVVGRDQKILRTRDGGRTWLPQVYPDPRPGIANIVDVDFPSLRRAYIISSDQRFMGYREEESSVNTMNGMSGENLRLNVYPNPVAAGEKLYLSAAVPSISGKGKVCVVDVLGTEIFTREFTANSAEEFSISIDMPTVPGIYFVSVSGAGYSQAHVPVAVR